MQKELIFVNNVVPGGIDKICSLWYYTPVLAYKVEFGTQYTVKKLARIDNAWEDVLNHGTLDDTIRTLGLFGPFLSPSQVHAIWESPAPVGHNPLLQDLQNRMGGTGFFRDNEELWFFGRLKYKVTGPEERYWVYRMDLNNISFPVVESGDINEALAALAQDGPYKTPANPDFTQITCVYPSTF